MDDDLEKRVWMLEQQMDNLHEIKIRQDALMAELQRYKGFAGGCLFIATCIGSFLPVLFSYWSSNAR